MSSRGAADLRVHELCVRYGSARVLESVSFQVGAGEIVGLAGRNGAGKTTVLRAIAGAAPRAAGSVLEFNGRSLPKAQWQVARLGISWVPEGRAIIPQLTALENLRYGALAVGGRAGHADLDEVLKLLPDLRPYLGQLGWTLSGGQQQLLAIARGVMARPKLLMIDEMSLGLSPKSVEVASQAVVRLRETGLGLLLVDQNVRGLARICDRLIVLSDGVSSEVDLADDTALEHFTSAYF
jgi:branched-chain amino acid transport system ATP-binding protein